MADGNRHIVNVYVPGDFFGLHVNFYRRAIHSLTALSEIEVAWIEPDTVLHIYREHPVLAAGLDWSIARSLNVLSERNVSLGIRPAARRILHFLLELYMRLLAIGEARDGRFQIPLTQEQLSDVCGLSLVHTNKTLANLQRDRLITWNRGKVGFPDVEKSMRECEFDSRFLAPFQLRASTLELSDS